MIIDITGVTSGTSPYDIFLCDWTLTSCFYVSGVTSIPPTIHIDSDNYFPNLDLLQIKIIDGAGCVFIEPQPCTVIPTPTPTPTASPTPTPTATPTPTPTATPTPTPTATPTPTPTASPTPTPTASPTPTPTATPIPCDCYTLEGGGPSGATFGYYDCSSVYQVVIVGTGVTVNYCMSTAPTKLSGIGGSGYYGICSGGLCPP